MHSRTVLSGERHENKLEQQARSIPAWSFLAQGCCSLKLCKNCHFNIKLNAIQHYWVSLGVFFFLLSLTLEGNLQVLPRMSWARAAESPQLGNSAVSSCKHFVCFCFFCKGSWQVLVLWSFLPTILSFYSTSPVWPRDQFLSFPMQSLVTEE